MVKDIAIGFNEFHARIQLTENQKETMNSRVTRTRELLEKAFPSTDSSPLQSATLMGSGARDTLIRPLQDIDIFATFTNKDGIFEDYRRDSKKFLYRIRERVDAKTSVEKVGARGQAVRLFYTDNLHVDIAPAFKWKGDGYALPAGDGTWLTTDPLIQTKWAEERNASLDNLYKRRVRMLKRWNQVHSARFSSWHLEVLVQEVLTAMTRNSREDLTRFFGLAASNVHVDDPDGHGGDLADYLTRDQEIQIMDLLMKSYERAKKALQAEGKGDAQESIRLWRVLLGEEFPSYG